MDREPVDACYAEVLGQGVEEEEPGEVGEGEGWDGEGEREEGGSFFLEDGGEEGVGYEGVQA